MDGYHEVIVFYEKTTPNRHRYSTAPGSEIILNFYIPRRMQKQPERFMKILVPINQEEASN